jgi:hypothetical protein
MRKIFFFFISVDGRIFGRLATLGSSCLSIPRLSSQSRELLCESSQNLFHLHYKLRLEAMKKVQDSSFLGVGKADYRIKIPTDRPRCKQKKLF